MTPEKLKLILAEVNNFKGIKHQLVRFDGKSAFVIGGNGIGKSSFIDAIRSAFDSDFQPTEPITAGEESGSVRVQVAGSSNVYDIYVKYTEKNKGGYITLHENGQEVKAPRTKITQIIGDFSFDIFDWMRAAFNVKVDMLKKASGCEAEINANEYKRAEAMTEKARLEKNFKEMTAVNSKKYRPFTDEEIHKYAKPIPEDTIEAELQGMDDSIKEWNRYNNGVKESLQKIDGWKKEMEGKAKRQAEIMNEIEALKKQIKAKSEQHDLLGVEWAGLNNNISIETTRREKGIKWLSEHSEPNTAEITNRLSEAKEHNRMVSLIAEYRERHKEMMAVKDKAEDQVKVIASLDKEKIAIIEASQLPVKGMTWDDKHIYLDGLPMEQGQQNTARLLDVGLEISMALNNPLKLVFLTEASLFDQPTLEATVQKIKERGYMVICEVVDPDGGEFRVEFSEESL